jgi:hypothetical protein
MAVERKPGWQQPAVTPVRRRPECLHFGLLFASFTLSVHPVGHQWVCTCGQVFVVTSGREGKTFAKSRH